MKRPIIVAMLCLAGAQAIAAPPVRDPDWPCQAIRIPDLSVGAFWSGPPLDDERAAWRQDEAVADLAGRITQRRMPMPEAEAAIRQFAGTVTSEARAARLRLLMAAVFDLLDGERHEVIAGLDRFGRRQKALAAGIRQKSTDLAAAQSAGDDTGKIDALTQGLTWDTRIFEQRRQSVQYACAVPNTIEQRLFALAKVILAIGQ